MNFEITDPNALQRIATAFNSQEWHTAYAEVLLALSDIVEENVYDPMTGLIIQTTTSLVRKTNVDPAVYIWITGALNVNKSEGAFAEYIRQYTALQYELRTGRSLSDAELQNASNDVARRFISDLFKLSNNITRIEQIWFLP